MQQKKKMEKLKFSEKMVKNLKIKISKKKEKKVIKQNLNKKKHILA